jgi:hypothetical protein
MDGKSPDTGIPINRPELVHVGEKPSVSLPEKPSRFDPKDTLPENLAPDPKFELELAAARRELKKAGEKSKRETPDDMPNIRHVTPTEKAEIEALRRGVGKEKPASAPTKPQRSILQKAGEVISKAAWDAKLVATMVSELGGFHPTHINGEWRWIIEPWARVQMDPRQGDMGNNDYYLEKFNQLKRNGVKTVDMNQIGGKTPYVRPLGTGIQLLDHRRIMTAQAVGLKILVKPLNYDTFN